MPSLRILAALALALVAGCATDKYGPPRTSWDDAPASTNTEVAPAAPPADKPEAKRTAADVAAAAGGANGCLDLAKRHGGEAGVQILRECMHRRDFVDLKAVLQEPWLAQVRSSAKLQARVVEVVARRGGFLEADLAEIAKAGVPVYPLNRALANPEAMRGALVVVRGTVEGVRSEKWGNRTGLVATLEETSWLEEQSSETPTLGDIERSAVERTGRKIYVRVEKREQLRRAAEVVVLMTFEAMRKTTNEDGEADDSAIGMFAAAFDASPALRE